MQFNQECQVLPQGWRTYRLGKGSEGPTDSVERLWGSSWHQWDTGHDLAAPWAALAAPPPPDWGKRPPHPSTGVLHPVGSASKNQTLISQGKSRSTLRVVRMGAVAVWEGAREAGLVAESQQTPASIQAKNIIISHLICFPKGQETLEVQVGPSS